MARKIAKNLVKSKDEYTRYFGTFAGVDFSSDHTEVSDSRFAFLKNMYKDYQSGQGQAIETIPGFRRILNAHGTVNGVHMYRRHQRKRVEGVYVESYVVKNIVHIENAFWIYDKDFTTGSKYVVELNENLPDGDVSITEIKVEDAPSISYMLHDLMYIHDGVNIFEFNGNGITPISAYVPTTYISAVTAGGTISEEKKDLDVTMGEYYTIKKRGEYQSYSFDEASTGEEHEARNLMTPWYRMTFVALDRDYTNCFQLNTKATAEETPFNIENPMGTYVQYPSKIKVRQYGTLLPWAFYGDETNEYGDSIDPYFVPEGYPNAVVKVTETGIVELVNAPPAPEKYPEYSYPPGHAGIEIDVYKPVSNVGGAYLEQPNPLAGCRVSCMFDNRIFLTGHPKYPHLIFWCGIDADTGFSNPSYFREIDYCRAGVGNAPITALLPVADTLMVLRRDTVQDGSVAFLSGQITEDNLYAKVYTVTQGLPGYGCLGACCNFLDDPIFISKLGVEAMGQLSVRYERAVEHRSSLIDAALLNCELTKASIVEWGGYMLILIEGKIFMADSRQRFTHSSDVMQYEWYYLEDIGVYNGQYQRYVYARFPHEGLAGTTVNELPLFEDPELVGQTANPPNDNYTTSVDVESFTDDEGNVIYYVARDGEAIFCEPAGAVQGEEFYPEYIGGVFDPAVKLFVIEEDLYFVTHGGVICKFNFDKRDSETRVIPNQWYTFDGRTIESGAAVKMDNCGVPHLTKTTVRKSVVIKTRSNAKSTAKIFVRTNRDPYKQVDRLISGQASFVGADFVDLTFGTVDQDKSLFAVKEREKCWVEKQYYIKSDEFMRPFALYYIVYSYYVAGRYKD